MTPDKNTPFITRDMLALGSGVQYSLQVSSQSLLSKDITIRGMTSFGQFTLHHTTDGQSVPLTEKFVLPDVPIFIMAFDETNAFWQGDCFIALDLFANNDLLYHLCAGYIYGPKKVAYPNVSNPDIRVGGGALYTISGTDPAANNEISETVPTGQFWLIQALTFILVADANVATRTVTLTITDAIKTYLTLPPATTQTAGQTVRYNYAPGIAKGNDPSTLDQTIPFPYPLILAGGAIISTVTTNRQATDNFSKPIIQVEKFLSPS